MGWQFMKPLLTVGIIVAAMCAGLATAQTTTSQTTTTTTPAVAVPAITPPPIGTLSTTRTEKTISADGTVTNSSASTYRNTAGVADDSVTTTTTSPPAMIIITDTKSTSTVTK